MAQRLNTLRYHWPTEVTTAPATNTTLATATRYEWAARTFRIPETGSRTIRSAFLKVYWRDRFQTTVRDWNGARVGIKIDAVAWSDTDFTFSTLTNTGDHDSVLLVADVTSYLVTNFTGASHSVQAALAVGTATTADVINNMSAELVVTYEYSDTGITETAYTIAIPIQTHHEGMPGDSLTEVGSLGTLPLTNQIPILTGQYVPSGATIRDAWLEVVGNEGTEHATDFATQYRIDAGATMTRTVIEQQAITGCYFRDLVTYDTTTYLPNAAHAFYATYTPAVVNTERPMIGAFLHVTYTVNPVGLTEWCNHARLIMDTPHRMQQLPSTLSTDAQRLALEFEIDEPGPITLMQSAIVLYWTGSGLFTASQIFVKAGAQSSFRGYAPRNPGAANGGQYAIIHRIDNDSGITLARGRNRFTVTIYTDVGNVGCLTGAELVLNYKSGIASGGVATHNRTHYWIAATWSGAGSSARVQSLPTLRVPSIPEAGYRLTNVGLYMPLHCGNLGSLTTEMEVMSGEHDGEGWKTRYHVVTKNDNGAVEVFDNFTDDFNRDPYDTGKCDIETDRRWARYNFGTAAREALVVQETHRTISYSCSGILTGYTGDGSGYSVKIYEHETGQPPRYLTTVTSVAGGTFTFTVYRDVDHYATVDASGTEFGASQLIAPGDAAAYVVRLSAGGGAITEPSFTSVDPADGSVLSGTDATLSFTVVNPDEVPFVLHLKFTAESRTFVVYDSDSGFHHPFTGTVDDSDPTAVEFTVRQLGGWQDAIEDLRIGGVA
jgi:hypothetical protein